MRGATAYKHIVFFNKKSGEWRFRGFNSPEEALQAAKTGILRLLELADQGRFDDIDSVVPFATQNLARGKILYMYHPDKFLPAFSLENLHQFCDLLGVVTGENPTATHMNRGLLKFKQEHPAFRDWSNFRFARFLYLQFPPKQQFWKIAPGEGARLWSDCKQGGFICIGWDDLGDLNEYDEEADLKKAWDNEYTEKKSKVKEIWAFKNLEEKDLIVANKGMSSIVGIGEVNGSYSFRSERENFKHCVRVRWLYTEEFPISAEHKEIVDDWFAWTVKELSREEFYLLTEGRMEQSRLRWRLASEGSFDLILENPEDLDKTRLETLYRAFMRSRFPAQPGFNEHLRTDLQSWIEQPNEILPSAAYVTLSNWFMSGPPFSGSERAQAAEALWDCLFLCRPPQRFSPTDPGQNHKMIPERFGPWWFEQQRRQGTPHHPVTPPGGEPDDRYAELCRETFLPASFFEECEMLLRSQRQIILQGAPGTGKTFVAEKLARWLAGHQDRVRVVQFHESYGYEDFVYGIKPKYDPQTGQTAFQPEEGIFLTLCETARRSEEKWILIIDEINRGKPSRIFGELLYLLEYRDKDVTLQSGRHFSIPDNLFVIGTMNTTDKSIALVDYALRRRFAFVTLRSVENGRSVVLSQWLQQNGIRNANEVERLFVTLNQSVSGKGDDLMIGHSYFMRPEAVAVGEFTPEILDLIWRYYILPLVSEYEYDLSPAEIEQKYGFQTINNQAGGQDQTQ